MKKIKLKTLALIVTVMPVTAHADTLHCVFDGKSYYWDDNDPKVEDIMVFGSPRNFTVFLENGEKIYIGTAISCILRKTK